METIDNETSAAAMDFMQRQVQAGRPLPGGVLSPRRSIRASPLRGGLLDDMMNIMTLLRV